MFRRWLSSFIKKNKKVIIDIAKKVGILIMIALLATAIMSGIGKNTPSTSQTNDSISIYKPTETVIEGKKISKDEYSKDEEIIDNFIKYCNEKDIDSAYNLLSDDCKKDLYKTVDDFRKNYYLNLFKSQRQYSMQSWVNEGEYHTYKVSFTDDLLSTGNYNNSNKGQDYITVVNVENDKKINLNGYVKREEIKKESSDTIMKSLVVEKKVYIDYVEYIVKLKNMTDSPLLLDTGMTKKSIKLVDENNVEYYAFKDMIVNLDGKVSPGVIRTLNIRFNKTYSVNVKDKYIEFSDIVTDWNDSINLDDLGNRKTYKAQI